tara:strand:- start:1243 stop:1479 length:237 start_codon:yes stop_codon:yes gene_type:complete
MGVRLTASQKERARKLFAADKSSWPNIDHLCYELADANKRNQSPDLPEEYYGALMAYYQHLRARLQIVKRRARFVKGC